MPSVITHAVVGIAAGKAFTTHKMPRRFWDLTIVCALLPDLDVIGFKFGIPYASFFGHRGFSHSPFFALIVGLAVAFVFYRKEKIFSRNWWFYLFYFFFVTATNGLMDAFTNGGEGVALLSPFSNARFFFPWRPIIVSPIGYKMFFTGWGLQALKSEIIWVWIPAAFIVICATIIKKYFANRKLKNV